MKKYGLFTLVALSTIIMYALSSANAEPNELRIYDVNKNVADFGDNDFSTPEAIKLHKKPDMQIITDSEANSGGLDYKYATITEGFGFNSIMVWDPNTTRDSIIKKLGQPEEQSEQRLNYDNRYGLRFWLGSYEMETGRWAYGLEEIKILPNFKGKLSSGITTSSSKQDVFKTYGQPIGIRESNDLGKSYADQILFQKAHESKIYYDNRGLMFWFKDGTIELISVSTNSVLYKERLKQSSRLSTEHTLCLPIPNSQPAGQAEIKNDFKATLSNGVTVELIGVCEHPSKDKQWWKPNGEIIKDMPYSIGGQIIEPTEGDQRLDLIAKIINANEQSPGVKFIIPGATRTSVGENVAINQMNVQMGMWAVRFKIDSALNFADITAGVASGEWQTISKIISSFKNIQRNDVDFGQIEWLKVIEENNEVVIYVSNNFSDKAEFQIVAEDVIGEIYPAYSSRCKGNAGLMSCEYKFHLSPDKAKEFKFQIRPYQWVEFKNVSLMPNVKTDVKIKVEKDTSEKSALDSRTNVSFRKDMSIRDALRFLGEKYKKNIIPSDKINGKLAVRELYDVTFEEILKAVIGTNKYIIDGNFIRVYTAEEYKNLKPNVKTDVQIGTVEDSRKLLMERRDILQKTLHDVEMSYNAGRADSKQLRQVKIDLLRVEIELSETPQKRVELLSQIVTIYTEQEKSTKLLLDAGRATLEELNKAKLLRLNAEEELAKAMAENYDKTGRRDKRWEK